MSQSLINELLKYGAISIEKRDQEPKIIGVESGIYSIDEWAVMGGFQDLAVTTYDMRVRRN